MGVTCHQASSSPPQVGSPHLLPVLSLHPYVLGEGGRKGSWSVAIVLLLVLFYWCDSHSSHVWVLPLHWCAAGAEGRR